MEKIHVLLVEDEQTLAMIYQGHTGRTGFYHYYRRRW